MTQACKLASMKLQIILIFCNQHKSGRCFPGLPTHHYYMCLLSTYKIHSLSKLNHNTILVNHMYQNGEWSFTFLIPEPNLKQMAWDRRTKPPRQLSACSIWSWNATGNVKKSFCSFIKMVQLWQHAHICHQLTHTGTLTRSPPWIRRPYQPVSAS